MNKITLLIFGIAIFAVNAVKAQNTYYVSNSGNDSNDGLTPATAWQTIDQVNIAAERNNFGGYIAPGSKVLFNRGDTFRGELIFWRSGTAENPIEISSYGTGNKPILTGEMNDPGIPDKIQVIKMINVNHVHLNNLHIKNNRQVEHAWGGGNSAYGIYVSATKWGGRTTDLWFKDLDITDIFAVDMLDASDNFTRDYYTARGIYFVSEKNHDNAVDGSPATTEVGIDNVIIEDCYFYNLGGRGISTTHKADNSNTNGATHRNQNYIIRNNYFERLGGDGVVFASIFNGLVENNEFHDLGYGDHTSSTDRYFGRGEGCWIWNSWNVVVQYNKQYNNEGYGDTYGAGGHVDFYCKNSLFQYNYSEDTDGGFVEILGDCDNSIFRYNVSVNDGHRTHHHNYTIWLSGYVGADNGVPRPVVPPRDNYIYNNTVYVNNAAIQPQISIFAEDTYIYNNAFMYANGSMGIRNEDGLNGYEANMQNSGVLTLSNNYFHGTINATFKSLDANRIDDGSFPSFQGAGGSEPDDYDIWNGSPLVDTGTSFAQPSFPAAGAGIFAHISEHPSDDGFGNTVDINNYAPNIGASNSHNANSTLGISDIASKTLFTIYPNPVNDLLAIQLKDELRSSTIQVFDVMGKEVHSLNSSLNTGENLIVIPSNIKNGIYYLKISENERIQTQQFILYR